MHRHRCLSWQQIPWPALPWPGSGNWAVLSLPACPEFTQSWALPSDWDHHHPASPSAAPTLLLSAFPPRLLFGFFHLGFQCLVGIGEAFLFVIFNYLL